MLLLIFVTMSDQLFPEFTVVESIQAVPRAKLSVGDASLSHEGI
jgi:hypothetical protein